jgi:glycerol-3-phosphate acyltransferase PlsX
MLQYAIMGAVISEHVLGFANPAIGLMSIGSEEAKGNEFTKEIFQYLKDTNLNFRGNIEGHSLFEDPVEVVLCNGFTGNVVLKEGMGGLFIRELKGIFYASIFTKLSALILKKRLKVFAKKMDYTEDGGAPLLGLNNLVVKAHGSSKAPAVVGAVRQCCIFLEKDITGKMRNEFTARNNRLQVQEPDTP